MKVTFDDELPQVQKMNDGSEWLKSIVPPEIMSKQFFLSLYESLKDNEEFKNLLEEIKKASAELDTNSEQNNNNTLGSIYYSNLSKTNKKFGEKFKQLENKLLDQVLHEVSHSYNTKRHTHSGFVHYLYYAWSNEMGICLRPDVIFYTIVCETIEYLRKNKNIIGLIKEITIPVCLEKDKLENNKYFDNLMVEIYENDIFRDLMTSSNFESEPDNFNIALKFASVKTANANFNNLSTMCGITQVEIMGEKSDWLKLSDKILLMKTIIPNLDRYYNKCHLIIKKIMSHDFYQSDHLNQFDFFKNIFYLEHIDNCKSSNSHVVVDGWFKDFYINKHLTLDKYPTHANYIPCIQNNKKYFKTMGMTYSECKNNILYPQYGEITYEVLDDNIFNSTIIPISNKKNNTTEPVDSINNLTNNENNTNQNTSYLGKLLEFTNYASDTTTNVLKQNWQTTLIMSFFVGAVGLGSIIISKLDRN